MTDALTTIARALCAAYRNGTRALPEDYELRAQELLASISPGIVADAVKTEREAIAVSIHSLRNVTVAVMGARDAIRILDGAEAADRARMADVKREGGE